MTMGACHRPLPCRQLLEDRHEAQLLELLEIPTAAPLETGVPSEVRRAQERYAAFAAEIGMRIEAHAPPGPGVLEGPEVPVPVREAAEQLGPAFLESQPNLVLRLGPERAPRHTLMFNVHLDTVGGEVAVGSDWTVVTGRGAVDAKGPAIALLAGIEQALRTEPDLADDVTILVQAVPGEEGGAMGVHGTKVLVEQGYVGRLNVFCEPTGGAFLDQCTAAMTARVIVDGEGSCDDDPGAGHNATVILGHLAGCFARHLLPAVHAAGGRACIAGLETGPMHNRVYGSGHLWLNFAYGSASSAGRIENLTGEVFARGCHQLERALGHVPGLDRTASQCREVTRLEWVKKGLPVLANRDPALERLLVDGVGLRRIDPLDGSERGLTCDAIWASDHPGYTIVLGPGHLDRNRAHADGEFVEWEDLRCFAATVADIILSFRHWRHR
jgi:acetylornithine deacetylase